MIKIMKRTNKKIETAPIAILIVATILGTLLDLTSGVISKPTVPGWTIVELSGVYILVKKPLVSTALTNSAWVTSLFKIST